MGWQNRKSYISFIITYSTLLYFILFYIFIGMTSSDHEEAAAILTVLPKLMNQMIVQLLLDDENKGTLLTILPSLFYFMVVCDLIYIK